MKQIDVLLIAMFILVGCSLNEKSIAVYSEPYKSVTEFMDGKKIHYREFDSKENELVHVYFNDDVEEKTISRYDSSNFLLTEEHYHNDSLIGSIIRKYEFDKNNRPLKILYNTAGKNETRLLRYSEIDDTLITTSYKSEEYLERGRWLTKKYTNAKDKMYRVEYHPLLGGGGEKIINHYSKNDLLDYQVHFYMKFDTTFYKYNSDDKVIRTEKKSSDRENYSDFEYDTEGNQTRCVKTKIVYSHGDTLLTDWNYKWKVIEK